MEILMESFYPYPLTIVFDRYSGAYSGGDFTAWNLDADSVPHEIYSSDVECASFWEENELPVGKGGTPELAVMDLKRQLI